MSSFSFFFLLLIFDPQKKIACFTSITMLLVWLKTRHSIFNLVFSILIPNIWSIFQGYRCHHWSNDAKLINSKIYIISGDFFPFSLQENADSCFCVFFPCEMLEKISDARWEKKTGENRLKCVYFWCITVVLHISSHGKIMDIIFFSIPFYEFQ